MIVLTDTREWTETLLQDMGPARPAFREDWRDLSVGGLLAAERILWETLEGGPWLALCSISPPPALAGWDYLVVIENAVGSQFDALRTLDSTKLPGSVACLAAGGDAFHGHHGRTWQTLRGNLHLSTICNPDLDAARCGLAMTTLPAVAVLDALDATGPWTEQPGIKWVNDILIGGAKVSGVLTATQSLRERLNALVLGIGLNIAEEPQVEPTPFVSRVACLKNLAADEQVLTVGRLLSEVLAAISARLNGVREEGPEALVDTYRERNLIVGRTVAIWPDHSSAQSSGDTPSQPLALGVVRAIGPDLALLLEGHDEPIRCGRLALQTNHSPG